MAAKTDKYLNVAGHRRIYLGVAGCTGQKTPGGLFAQMEIQYLWSQFYYQAGAFDY